MANKQNTAFRDCWTNRRQINNRVGEHMRSVIQNRLETEELNITPIAIRGNSDNTSRSGMTQEQVYQPNSNTAISCRPNDTNSESLSTSTGSLSQLCESDSLNACIESTEDFCTSSFSFHKNLSSNNDSVDSDTDAERAQDFLSREDLGNWAINNKVTNNALSSLLKILQKHHPNLPKDARTLLHTNSINYKPNIKTIKGGSYYHFGIENSVVTVLRNNVKSLSDSDTVWLQLNFDGLPIFKSSNLQFWPILGMVNKTNLTKQPFLIGLFCGNSKPLDLKEYLFDFVQEMKTLETIGINVKDKHYELKISSIICDAPARAFIKNCKLHNSYFGCEKCEQEGVWTNNKITFPEFFSTLRTDANFHNKTQEEHHKGDTPLADLCIGLVSQIPLDYMHLVCLGATRYLLRMWVKGPLPSRLQSRVVADISEKLISLRPSIPREIARKPRSLKELDRWKATELRTFLLYTGPIVLKDCITKAHYQLFMLLSVAIYCLSSPSLYNHYLQFANDLLRSFVKNCMELFGSDACVYNIHSLIHLAQECQLHGPLDGISAFPFENFLGILKRSVRKPEYPLQQIIRRHYECNGNFTSDLNKDITGNNPLFKKPCYNCVLPTPFKNFKQFEKVQFLDFLLTNRDSDNCIVTDTGKFGLVRNIITDDKEVYVIFEDFKTFSSLFTFPLQSSDLDVGVITNLSGNKNVCNVKDLRKCLYFSKENTVFPFCHL